MHASDETTGPVASGAGYWRVDVIHGMVSMLLVR